MFFDASSCECSIGLKAIAEMIMQVPVELQSSVVQIIVDFAVRSRSAAFDHLFFRGVFGLRSQLGRHVNSYICNFIVLQV